MSKATLWPCRLCGAGTQPWARHKILRKHDVAYVRCVTCESIQTEPPYWLDEAYAATGLGSDTGAPQRCLNLALQTATFLRLAGWSPSHVCLDFGAGTGLFARMMRDRGYQFMAYDRHQAPYYMDHFCVADPGQVAPKLITAHEVLEHLPNPREELPAIFGRDADLILLTTETCDGQRPDWWYLSPEHGQHVFFYSSKAMMLIAAQYRYACVKLPEMYAFWRQPLEAMEQAIAVAHNGPMFAQAVLQDFCRHQASPFQFAMRDSQKVLQLERT